MASRWDVGTLKIHSFELGFELRRFYINFGGMRILQPYLADFFQGLPTPCNTITQFFHDAYFS